MLTELTKVSSSSKEISNCLSEINNLWKLIDWPDYKGSQFFFNETGEFLSQFVIKYANIVKKTSFSTQESETRRKLILQALKRHAS